MTDTMQDLLELVSPPNPLPDPKDKADPVELSSDEEAASFVGSEPDSEAEAVVEAPDTNTDLRRRGRWAPYERQTSGEDALVRFAPPMSQADRNRRCEYTYSDLDTLTLPAEAFRPIPAETIQTRSVRTIPLLGFGVFSEFFTPSYSRNSLRLIYFRQPQAVGITFPWLNWKARISAPARQCKLERRGDNIHIWMPVSGARFYCAEREKFANFSENEKLKKWCFENMAECYDGSSLSDPEFGGQGVIKWKCVALGCEKSNREKGNRIAQTPAAKISAAKLAHQFCELCVQHSAKLPPAPQQAPAQRKNYYYEPEVELEYDPMEDGLEYDDVRHPDFVIETPEYVIPENPKTRRSHQPPPVYDPLAALGGAPLIVTAPYKRSPSPSRSPSRSRSPPGPASPGSPRFRKLADLPDPIRYRERTRIIRERNRLEYVREGHWDKEAAYERAQAKKDWNRLGRPDHEYVGRNRPASPQRVRARDMTIDSYRPKYKDRGSSSRGRPPKRPRALIAAKPASPDKKEEPDNEDLEMRAAGKRPKMSDTRDWRR
ncbi:hypothetical protein EDC01DRAFT_755132 [Geopyxis carbonaria]|nr:hypothetical protein EDC01DRAFT_755132 [Geopyxis carbonaria]